MWLTRSADLERGSPQGWVGSAKLTELLCGDPAIRSGTKWAQIIQMPSLVRGGGKSRRRLRNAWEQSLELNYFNKQTLNWPNVQCWTEADCPHVILVNSITHNTECPSCSTIKPQHSSFILAVNRIDNFNCLFEYTLHALTSFYAHYQEQCNWAVALQCEAYQGWVN